MRPGYPLPHSGPSSSASKCRFTAAMAACSVWLTRTPASFSGWPQKSHRLPAWPPAFRVESSRRSDFASLAKAPVSHADSIGRKANGGTLMSQRDGDGDSACYPHKNNRTTTGRNVHFPSSIVLSCSRQLIPVNEISEKMEGEELV